MRQVCCIAVVVSSLLGGLVPSSLLAQPDDFNGIVAGPKHQVLYLAGPPKPSVVVLDKSAKLKPLDDLQFTGPRPSHPFVLGNFAADGTWGIAGGYLQPVSGKNAAIQLAWADQFELEGIMHQSGYGGWFVLLGWNRGTGHGLSSATLKQSGTPWFLSEFRGGKAIEGRTLELDKFEWKDEQPFRLLVQNNSLTLEVGKFTVIDRQPLESYSPGAVIFGVYDTRYGPRPLKVKSMRIRALTTDEAAESKP